MSTKYVFPLLLPSADTTSSEVSTIINISIGHPSCISLVPCIGQALPHWKGHMNFIELSRVLASKGDWEACALTPCTPAPQYQATISKARNQLPWMKLMLHLRAWERAGESQCQLPARNRWMHALPYVTGTQEFVHDRCIACNQYIYRYRFTVADWSMNIM